MTRLCRFLLSTALLGVAIPARADLLLTGFEEPDVEGDPFKIRTFNGGQTIDGTITDWLVGLTGVDVVHKDNIFVLGGAHSGVQYLDLNSTGAGSIETQFDTVIGVAYTLEFYYANNYNQGDPPPDPVNPSAVRVTVDAVGSLVDETRQHTSSVANNLNWTQFTQTFVADLTGATTLKFEAFPPSDTQGGGILLDTISVTTAVPEAGGWLLGGLGWGVIGLGYARRTLARLIASARG